MTNTGEIQSGATKELFQLLSQLVEVQTTNAMLTAKIFIKEGKQKVNAKVQATRESIIGKAQMYGQRIEKIVEQYNLNEEVSGSVMAEYKQTVSDINELYCNRMKNIIAEKVKMESEEMKEIAIYIEEQFGINKDDSENEMDFYVEDDRPVDRINRLSDSVNSSLNQERDYIQRDEFENRTGKGTTHSELIAEKVKLTKKTANIYAKGILMTEAEKNRLNEIQSRISEIDNEISRLFQPGSIKLAGVEKRRNMILEAIEACKSEMIKCFEDRDKALENADVQKDTQLAVIKKQNLFQKLIGRFVNGGKKFKKEVIDTMSVNAAKVRDEKLPIFKDAVETTMIEFSMEMYNRRMEIRDKKEQQRLEREEAREERKTQREELKEKRRIEREETKEKRRIEREERKAQRKEDWDKFRNAVKNRMQYTVDTIISKGRAVKVAVLEKANNSLKESLEKSLEAKQAKSSRLAPIGPQDDGTR